MLFILLSLILSAIHISKIVQVCDIYIYVTYRYTLAISWHTVPIPRSLGFQATGRSPCAEVGFEKPPHIYGMHTLRDEKDVEGLAEAYNRSAPLLGFVGFGELTTVACFFVCFLTLLRRHCIHDDSRSHCGLMSGWQILEYMTFFFLDTYELSMKLVLFGVAYLALPYPQIRL